LGIVNKFKIMSLRGTQRDDGSLSPDSSPPNHLKNHYLPKPSYKDALLDTVSDPTNRMGVNTFKLIHLLKKSENTKDNTQASRDDVDEDASGNSEETATKRNAENLQFYRMRF
jgi:hypothetical protein